MARSKTSSFWLTETVNVAAVDTFTNGTVAVAAYVDVGDSQGLFIEEVSFVIQSLDTTTNSYTGNLQTALAGDAAIDFQLSDQPFPAGTMLRAGAVSLIASGTLNYDDTNNVTSLGTDLYPDAFGTLDEAFVVINDQIYFQALLGISAPIAARNIAVTARIKCRVATLSKRDWMAKAITQTGADN
jgi:hypothetical protein